MELTKDILTRNNMFDELIMNLPNGATLSGHFHSYKYFDPHARSLVLDKFRFPYKILKGAQEFLQPFLQDHGLEIVCSHIRQDDDGVDNAAKNHHTWSISSYYYHKAIQIMNRKLGNFKLIVFIEGSLYSKTKANIVDSYFNTSNVTVYENTNLIMTMQVMALCPNLIMSVSTFSWWAAYLGEHKNVIAPETLYSDIGFKPEDYYLPSWTLVNEKTM